MLEALLGHIDRIYGLGLEVRIEEYLIDRETCLELSGDATERTLVIQPSEPNDEIQVGVYLGDAVLSRLNELGSSAVLIPHHLGLICTAIEEVSHFAYLFWNANRGKQVTQLELEIQGEVDKFITAVLLAARENQGRVPGEMVDLLFGDFELREGLDATECARYRVASSFARTYCRSLFRRFLREARLKELLIELRYFYRLSQKGKIEHIHRAVYTA